MSQPASTDQLRTFWSMLADRKWDDTSQFYKQRRPRTDYLKHIWYVYDMLQRKQAPTSEELSAVIDDLYCFNGWAVKQRLRNAR